MKIILNEKTSIEEAFAEIEIDTLRAEFRKAQDSPEKNPAALKALIAIPNFPEKFVAMAEKRWRDRKSNRILL